MQKNRSKQKGRINKNQNKTKICKGSSRWGKCRLLPLLEGLIASGKYLTGKFAAETHTAMVAMHFLCTQGKQWLFYWMYWKPCRSGFQNLGFFQSLEEEVAGCPLCLVCHSPRAWIWWAILIGLCNVLYGRGAHTGYRWVRTAGCLELYFHQGDAGLECGRAKADVDTVLFTSSWPQG